MISDRVADASFNLFSASSRLLAAPDRVEHRNTLRHLETVLNVKVYHEVDEFLAFLGVSILPAGADVQSMSQVPKAT